MENQGSPYKFRIERIELANSFDFRPKTTTIFVGPNNTGKSQVLKDIVRILTQIDSPAAPVMVRTIEVDLPDSFDALKNSYNAMPTQNSFGAAEFSFLGPSLREAFILRSEPIWGRWESDPFVDKCPRSRELLLRYLGPSLVAYLSTDERLRLVKQTLGQPEDQNRVNDLLSAFFRAGSGSEREVRKVVRNAFGVDIALDYATAVGCFQIRVGRDFSILPPDPRDARPLLESARKLDNQGDGMRSFIGIVVALIAASRPVTLVDEPEAFLHPPQAFRIGEFLAERRKERQVFISTHSVDVLRGLLAKDTKDVLVIRLAREGDNTKCWALEPARLQEIMTNPLLSSARVLDGLFFNATVVVEGDSDARFYHAVSSRCNANLDLHFVRADNKQTVARILRMYRELGVAAAGIVDIDILNDAEEFSSALEELGACERDIETASGLRLRIAAAVGEDLPENRLDRLSTQLNETMRLIVDPTLQPPAKVRKLESMLHKALNSVKIWAQVKRTGTKALSEDGKATFLSLSAICTKYGLLISPCGQLESMLVDQGIEFTSDKKAWIQQALTMVPRLNVNKEEEPWRFMYTVHEYLGAPDDLGLDDDQIPNS